MPLGHRLEEHYSASVSTLSPAARLWVVLAAAESTGDASVVRGAARALGLPDAASAEAEALRLVEVRDSVRFRHPLVRSAVYNSATDADRRAVHAALRDETSARGLRELAAWHAAAACAGPDAEVATELAGIADLAGARGGLRSRAHLLARAAELAPEPSDAAASGSSAPPRPRSARARGCCRASCSRAPTATCSTRWGADGCSWSRRCARCILADPRDLRQLTATLLAAADQFRGEAPDREQKALVLALNAAHDGRRPRGRRRPRAARRADARRRRRSPRHRYAVALARGRRRSRSTATTWRIPSCARRWRLLEAHGRRRRSSTSASTPSCPASRRGTAMRHRACSRAPFGVARERGALLEVDAALWVLSAVELSRVNPRLAGEYLAQAEELRRALGYVDEQAVNAAYLAWQGAPSRVVEQIAARDARGRLRRGRADGASAPSRSTRSPTATTRRRSSASRGWWSVRTCRRASTTSPSSSRRPSAAATVDGGALRPPSGSMPTPP